jgi:hypothetical protein
LATRPQDGPFGPSRGELRGSKNSRSLRDDFHEARGYDVSVQSWRRLFLTYRTVALMFIVVAVMLKALVPTGYMVSTSSRVFAVELCGKTADAGQASHQLVIPFEDHSGKSSTDQPMDVNCQWSALSMAGLAGAGPELLALALVVILLLGRLPSPFRRTGEFLHARPPLRGPPVPA